MKTILTNNSQLIGGFTMLGMAGGWIFGNLTIGLFLGIGLGMIITSFTNKKNEDGE